MLNIRFLNVDSSIVIFVMFSQTISIFRGFFSSMEENWNKVGRKGINLIWEILQNIDDFGVLCYIEKANIFE